MKRCAPCVAQVLLRRMSIAQRWREWLGETQEAQDALLREELEGHLGE